jgi:pimeloyl-ACP methyl ester carboxylesterase
MPEGKGSVDKTIILLHGLNEKSWNKYLPWARDLVLRTGYAVILFPISFHMNRSPEDWANPRNMSGLSRLRKSKYENLSYSSFANAAMSERLDNMPERFALSGYQSVMDLLALVNNVSSGRHPLFTKNTEIHFFGYSIGAFLAQVLMIANPGGIFNSSKFLLFAGGNVFSRINGISRFIMDQPAFAQLRAFYLDEKQWRNKAVKSYVEVMDVKHIARAFIAMLSPDHFSPLREKVFREFKDQIKVIALKEDMVFPLEYIYETFEASGIQVSVPDLPYPYTHEVPFPVSSKAETSVLVDQSFVEIFMDAAAFLKGKH